VAALSPLRRLITHRHRSHLQFEFCSVARLILEELTAFDAPRKGVGCEPHLGRTKGR
jgi:hypothetical protein